MEVDRPRQIDLLRLQAFGFHENLMSPLVREFYELVLDGRTVPRTDPLDVAPVHDGFREVLPHDGLGFRRGVDDVAGHLGLRDPLTEETEGPRRIVARLDL